MNQAKVAASPTQEQTSKGRWKLLLVLAVCAAPMIASYFTYFVIKPAGGQTNYGTLLDPRQYPMPELAVTTLDGKLTSLDHYKGKWIFLQVDGGACAAACQRQLLEMRQLRLMQGKEMERIERVWLITDQAPLDTVLMREFDGTDMLRVAPEPLKKWLPTESGTTMDDHLYLIDPLGHLMMRFPKDPDPGKMKKDIYRLLKASAIG